MALCHPTCHAPTDPPAPHPRQAPVHADGCPNEGGPIITKVMDDRYQVEDDLFPGVTTEYDADGNELAWDGTAWVTFDTPIMGWLDCRFVLEGSEDGDDGPVEYFRCLTHAGDDSDTVTIGNQVSCGAAEIAHRSDAPVPTPADSLGPVHIYEARCTRCGETFSPNDENDLEHIQREDEQPCGGQGVMLGTYHDRPAKEA